MKKILRIWKKEWKEERLKTKKLQIWKKEKWKNKNIWIEKTNSRRQRY